MSAPELSVVCKSCGSEVSPYVTECPYCGARLRKRAPKLKREGEGLEPRTKRRRRPRLRRPRIETFEVTRPYATIAVIAASVVMILVQRATGNPPYDLGAIVGDDLGAILGAADTEWWRYFTAPFVYIDTGYLFVVAVGLALFGPGLERRMGSVATLVLLVACGALGMLAADAIDPTTNLQIFDPSVPATEFRPFGAPGDAPFPAGLSGGNGMALGALAAWVAIRVAETRRAVDEDFDTIGVGVAASVLILLPLFDDEANVYAALAGMLVGLLAGIVAAALRPSE